MKLKEAIKLLNEHQYIVERNNTVFYDDVAAEMGNTAVEELDEPKENPYGDAGTRLRNPITSWLDAVKIISWIMDNGKVPDYKQCLVCYIINLGPKGDNELPKALLCEEDCDLFIALTPSDFYLMTNRLEKYKLNVSNKITVMELIGGRGQHLPLETNRRDTFMTVSYK